MCFLSFKQQLLPWSHTHSYGKSYFTRSAPIRMVMCETLTDVSLISTSETDWPLILLRSEGLACSLHQHLGATSMRVSPSTKILAESSKKDCPSDVSLGERNPNQCSPSSNGTITLTGAPLSGTRAATYWQRQRGTRNRRHLASNLCTGSCGKAGSPHAIMLRNSRVLEVLFTHHPRNYRYAWMVKFKGNNTFVVSESITRQKTELHLSLKCVTVGELIFKISACDGCATSHT